jgi:uncharacterized membrane protein
MAEPKEHSPPKSRIESLSDLIFGLALSIGALTLIGKPPGDFGQMVQSILFYAFSFLILISVWHGYTRTMSELRVETPTRININILLLFLVSIEPFLFNELTQPASSLVENVSILYALDLGALFVIQAFFANAVLADKNKPEELLRTYRFRRVTLLISSILFFISAVPIFWVWTMHVNGVTIPLRVILWLIPLFLPSIRRLMERKTSSQNFRLSLE